MAASRRLEPAAEWNVDNDDLIETAVRQGRLDLPANDDWLLPELAGGPLAGYPRIFGVTWDFCAHLDTVLSKRFMAAYQSVQPLMTGDLWAMSVILRIVLIENLRRLVDEVRAGRAPRGAADVQAGRLARDGHGAVPRDRIGLWAPVRVPSAPVAPSACVTSIQVRRRRSPGPTNGSPGRAAPSKRSCATARNVRA